MRHSIIAAISENHVLGRAGELPWHLSNDLRQFKRLTTGHAIIMGRRTWESIGRPLPGRVSIVITQRPDAIPDGVFTAPSLADALCIAAESAAQHDEVFLIGGGTLYRAALPISNRIYLTRVHATIEGDTTFPDLDWSQWQLVEESHHQADARNDYPHTFQVWDRWRSEGPCRAHPKTNSPRPACGKRE
ncbi:MAG: dihydrofolate reductase [Pirellulales bacterium]|nr:dihydrofolate reductase [Pirellulales bacterium]